MYIYIILYTYNIYTYIYILYYVYRIINALYNYVYYRYNFTHPTMHPACTHTQIDFKYSLIIN